MPSYLPRWLGWYSMWKVGTYIDTSYVRTICGCTEYGVCPCWLLYERSRTRRRGKYPFAPSHLPLLDIFGKPATKLNLFRHTRPSSLSSSLSPRSTRLVTDWSIRPDSSRPLVQEPGTQWTQSSVQASYVKLPPVPFTPVPTKLAYRLPSNPIRPA